ncbi:amino acid ABC transporter substrate-binding protein [Brevibacillus brevis]|uniref:amino acid ABC transporter substrate-binding protein n=1 Tax=Brevibacillus brevis TaxID=1393 RepID=UPI000D111632|nr:amino acid ABC transporter substrate-binding protein [Brevibacillus brevis]PSJ67427.1 amino acid ABC transporter substrate-binding protein [Brevibacillus brevis]RED28408.1 polar amino acid transport system substrate-binding protein [Brevibacillus brevis]GEC90662.1 amino acid ABC transporter substrate-binding protein [Brevibacillus brevis]VEF91103.1 Sulfate starvation-induced protein 7 [Brevibacillus brevis]
MKKIAWMSLLLSAMVSLVVGCSSANTGADANKLIIGIDDKFAPMGFRDEKNELVGFDIDYARAAGEKMGKQVEFQPIDWSAKESELNSGRIDLIWNGYTITDERKEKVLFTKPYLKNAQVVVTMANSNLTKLSDLAGKGIGLQKLSSAADAINASDIKNQVKSVTEFPDNVLALSDLKIGRVEAVVIDQIVADYYMAKEPGTFKQLEESLSPEEYGIGVKKGNEALLNELQKALDAMNQDGTAAKISEKWFGENRVLK